MVTLYQLTTYMYSLEKKNRQKQTNWVTCIDKYVKCLPGRSSPSRQPNTASPAQEAAARPAKYGNTGRWYSGGGSLGVVRPDANDLTW